MTYATVRAAAQEAAKRGSLTPHQLAALGRLDELLTNDQRQQFTDLWRACGSPAAPPAGKFTPSAPFAFQVTKHVVYGELALFQEARRFTAQHQCDTAQKLCQFLEEARAAFGGAPVIITSGYRPPSVNAAVGGASRSEHLYDAPGVGAVDFYIDGADINEVQSWADRIWPFSLGYGAPKGFVHVGIRQGAPRVRWVY
jgi:hypothetical protein